MVSTFTERLDPIFSIVPGLLSLTAIFFRDRTCGRAQIFRRFADVRHATLRFFSRLRRNRGALIWFSSAIVFPFFKIVSTFVGIGVIDRNRNAYRSYLFSRHVDHGFG
jgi:hypothetical protein